VSKDADEQGLLHQPGDDVVIRAPCPKQRGERHVDDDQGGGDEGDFPAEQAETRVDVGREYAEKIVNYARIAHGQHPSLDCGATGAGVRPRKRSRDSAQAARQSASLAAASPSCWQRRRVSRRGSAGGWKAGAAGGAEGLSFRAMSIAVAVTAIATNTTAPSRARILPSMASLPVSCCRC